MRIAAYCRVSTDRDEQLESLENQKLFFEDFAARYCHTLIKIYADEGISGKQMENRAQFMRMLSDSKADLFDMVVVKDISRFARNTVDFLTAVRDLRAIGVEVQFLSNNQTVLGNSEFILTIFSAMAQEESANLSKRVRFGKKVNARRGRVPNIIFGYDKVDTFTMKINEDEAKTVRKIFDMYTQDGHGSRKIAITLNAAHTLSKKDCLWKIKTIRRILSNPVYKGCLVNNKMETVDFLTGRRQDIPAEDQFIHDRPELRIISEEQFELAQRLIAKRQTIYRNGKPGYSNRYTFSALIKCAHCGHSFSRRTYTYKNTYVRWRCIGNNAYTKQFCPNNTVIDEGELTQFLRDYLMSCIADKDKFVESVIAETQNLRQTQCDHESVNPAVLLVRIEKLTQMKKKQKNMYESDIISLHELKWKCADIDRQIAELRRAVSDAQTSSLRADGAEQRAYDTMRDIGRLLALEEYTNADIRKIIDRIVADENGKVKVYLLPS